MSANVQWILASTCWVCVFWQLIFLGTYVRKIWPLRRRNDVLAPPVGLTFAYHLIVTGIVSTLSVGTIIRIQQGAKPIITTYILVGLIAALAVATYLFKEAYGFMLRLADQRAHPARTRALD